MKIWVTHEDLKLMIYGLENTRYAYGHHSDYVDDLTSRLIKLEGAL